MPPRTDLLAEFWTRVDDSGGEHACWPWRGKRNRDGYGWWHNGSGRIGGGTHRRERAHRFAFALASHQDAREGFVLHSCDSPSCCNPTHLYLGTNADNMRDRQEAGRYAVGTEHPHAKLTEDTVRQIRASTASLRVLAALHGVSHTHVRRIRAGQFWEHVT